MWCHMLATWMRECGVALRVASWRHVRVDGVVSWRHGREDGVASWRHGQRWVLSPAGDMKVMAGVTSHGWCRLAGEAVVSPHGDTDERVGVARFEVNQHPIADVIPVLLKIDGAPLSSIDGDSRTWAKHISRPTEAQKQHKVTKYPWTTRNPIYVQTYEYQKQQGNMALTSRATGFEPMIHKSKRVVDTLQTAIGSVEIQASVDTIHPAPIITIHPTSIGTVYLASINIVHLATNLEIEMRYMLEYMVEDDEQYGFEEPSRVEEAGTRDLASQSIGITTSPSIEFSSVQSQRGLRFRDEVNKGPAEAASIDTDQIPSNDTTDAISNDINKSALIDATTTPSIDTGHVSEQKEFDVCGNLFDGETTTQSNNSGGKKRRNWKKRKRTKGGSQLSLIPRFSDGVKKSRVRSRCFSKPFAKVRALLIVEMIDKGEESMEEAFTQE
ncbi:hypothetical protein DY000_02015901 [Brassica cretica]|uniref:DUF4283 domain-containing protein n=1 Tax=Brassica cretica TaxID=69181 RepID=A0ABQ7CYY2_BRACR|nr:hypothetical protein DY000_02015901 [Brassica cretica]